jgi:hypothetical protein
MTKFESNRNYLPVGGFATRTENKITIAAHFNAVSNLAIRDPSIWHHEIEIDAFFTTDDQSPWEATVRHCHLGKIGNAFLVRRSDNENTRAFTGSHDVIVGGMRAEISFDFVWVVDRLAYLRRLIGHCRHSSAAKLDHRSCAGNFDLQVFRLPLRHARISS